MDRKKKVFMALCIVTVAFVLFMFIPDNDTPKDLQAMDDNIPLTNEAEKPAVDGTDESPNLEKTDEWDSEEFVEDKETEILGTFARKTEADTTVFIYFDREGVLLRETHKGSDVKKELGRYSLSSSTLNIDGDEHTFDRDGDNIVIDGKMWEYLEGVILSVV